MDGNVAQRDESNIRCGPFDMAIHNSYPIICGAHMPFPVPCIGVNPLPFYGHSWPPLLHAAV